MGRRTNSSNRERKDYTGLLLELQGKAVSPPQQAPVVAPKPKTPYSPYRQRIMSDETVKFLYSKGGGQFHDKSCPKVQKIPDEELCCSGKYLSNISQCPYCAVKAYVRLGAKDFYNYPLYEKLFQRMRFTTKLLRRMYVNEKMRTSASSNGLTIWGKEDAWRLEFCNGSDTMRLMYNNYFLLPDGTRMFPGGYHLQAERATANYAFAVISGYTYEGHRAAMLQREQERLAQRANPALTEVATKQHQVPGIWKMVLLILEKYINRLRRIFRK